MYMYVVHFTLTFSQLSYFLCLPLSLSFSLFPTPSLPQEIDVGDSPILSLCSVGDKVWVGFEIGYILIFSSSTHHLFAQAWLKQYTPIVSIVHIPDLKRVYVTLGNGSVLAYHDEVTLLPGNDCCKVTLQSVCEYHDRSQSATCVLTVPVLNQSGNVISHELWVGQSNGMITVLNPNDLSTVKFIQNTSDTSEMPSYMAHLTYANLVCSVSSSGMGGGQAGGESQVREGGRGSALCV